MKIVKIDATLIPHNNQPLNQVFEVAPAMVYHHPCVRTPSWSSKSNKWTVFFCARFWNAAAPPRCQRLEQFEQRNLLKVRFRVHYEDWNDFGFSFSPKRVGHHWANHHRTRKKDARRGEWTSWRVQILIICHTGFLISAFSARGKLKALGRSCGYIINVLATYLKCFTRRKLLLENFMNGALMRDMLMLH